MTGHYITNLDIKKMSFCIIKAIYLGIIIYIKSSIKHFSDFTALLHIHLIIDLVYTLELHFRSIVGTLLFFKL